MAGAPALEVSGLVKVFPGKRPVRAVDGVSFNVAPGEVVGLLGPNGAGKTTIIKCVLGLVRATAGTTRVFGAETAREPRRVLAFSSAVMEGSRNTYWRLTAWENVCFFASLNGVWHGQPEHRRYFEELIEGFGLSRYRNTQVRELSTGYKQKVAVVSALARRTPLVFLDEPTLGLDVESALEIRRLLRDLAANEHRTVVLSSHNMDVVQAVCRRVIIVSAGRLIADESVENLLALFRSRRYHLEIPGRLPEAVAAAIVELSTGAEVAEQDGMTRLDLHLPDAPSLYRLVDLLRDGGAVIESIAQREPNLEQAFLELVRRERERS